MDTVEAAEWLDLQPVSKCTKRVRLSQGEGESNLGEMWRSCAGHLGNESMHDQPFCCIAQRSLLTISSLHCVYCVPPYGHDTVIEPLQVLSVMTDGRAGLGPENPDTSPAGPASSNSHSARRPSNNLSPRHHVPTLS